MRRLKGDELTLLRASYDAFNSRDWDSIAAMYADDCVWDLSRMRYASDLEFEPVFRGIDGLHRFFEVWATVLAGWERPGGTFTTNFDDAWLLDDGRLLVAGWLGVRADTSDESTRLETFGQIASLRDGEVAEIVVYPDPDAARRDAGEE